MGVKAPERRDAHDHAAAHVGLEVCQGRPAGAAHCDGVVRPQCVALLAGEAARRDAAAAAAMAAERATGRPDDAAEVRWPGRFSLSLSFPPSLPYALTHVLPRSLTHSLLCVCACV